MDSMLEMMKDMDLNCPASCDDLKKIETEFKIVLPKQYFDFMRLHNGGEGPIGKYGYLAIFSLKELIDSNGDDKINDYHPGLFYFASDRGGMIYAFNMHTKEKSIVELPCDSIDFEDVEVIAESFGNFINYIYNIDDSKFE